MDKSWDDFYESLAAEIKREIAENYFAEKLYLEEEWNSFNTVLEDFKKIQKELFNNAWRLYFMLKDPVLVEEFEKLTGFPLKETCFQSKELYPSFYNISETELKEKLFKELFLPFAFTTKGKFSKLFYNIYKKLYESLEKYLKEYKKLERYYTILKEKTEEFHKKFDLSYILSFFNKLAASHPEIGKPEEKEKIWEELAEKLKIQTPPPLEEIFKKYKRIPKPSQLYFKLPKLAKKAFNNNPEEAKEILKLVY